MVVHSSTRFALVALLALSVLVLPGISSLLEAEADSCALPDGCFLDADDELDLMQRGIRRTGESPKASIGSQVGLAVDRDTDLIRVPTGRLHAPGCVQEVPSGTSVGDHGEMLAMSMPGEAQHVVSRCRNESVPTAHGIAWKTWAQYRKPGSTRVTKVVNTWEVPPDPAHSGAQTLYYWNGVEDGVDGGDGTTGVLQPVLQWSNGAWGIRCWWVTDGNSVVSSMLQVKAGDQVSGEIIRQPDGNWTCGASAGDQTTTMNYTGSADFTLAYIVFEAYGVDVSKGTDPDSSLYPNSGHITFHDTQLAFDYAPAQPPLAWETHRCPEGPGCQGPPAELGETTIASHDGEVVTLKWGAS